MLRYRAGCARRFYRRPQAPYKTVSPVLSMKHTYLPICAALAALCFIAMLAVTAIWMYVPTRIVYRESSPVRTEVYAIEVREHGQAYFVTQKQKYILDLIRSYTSIIWFSCFGYLFLFVMFGGFARLRLLQRQKTATADESRAGRARK